MYYLLLTKSIYLTVCFFELHLLTEFDRKARGELHLNKLPEFIKVLEGCDHLQNIQ